MRAVALRLPSGRLATSQWRSIPSLQRHSRLSSSAPAVRVPDDESESTPTDNNPLPARLNGRRRVVAPARAKTGIPSPPPVPSWFFDHHVHDPSPWRDAHFMADWKDAKALHAWHFSHRGRLTVPHYSADTYRHGFEKLFLRERATIGGQSSDPASPPSHQSPSADDVPARPRGSDQIEQVEGVSPRIDTTETRRKYTEQVDNSVREAIASEIAQEPFANLDWALFQIHILVSSSLALVPAVAESDIPLSRSHLMLTTTEPEVYHQLRDLVHDVVDMTGARLISLDAGIIADLAGEYIDGPTRGPGTVSDLAYDAYEGCLAPDNENNSASSDVEGLSLQDIATTRDPKERMLRIKNMLSEFISDLRLIPTSEPAGKDEDDVHVPDLTRWQALKLEAFWDGLLVARQAENAGAADQDPSGHYLGHGSLPLRLDTIVRSLQANLDIFNNLSGTNLSPRFKPSDFRCIVRRTMMRHQLVQYLTRSHRRTSTIDMDKDAALPPVLDASTGKTIVHIRDLNVIRDTPQGQIIVERLLKSIEKRRKLGEAIVVIGTNAEFSESPESDYTAENESDFLHVPVTMANDDKWRPHSSRVNSPPILRSPAEQALNATRRDIANVNLRNIQVFAQRLGIPLAERSAWRAGLTSKLCTQGVLTREQVHEIVLFANGFSRMYTTDQEIGLPHVEFAVDFLAPRFGVFHDTGTIREVEQPVEKAPVKTQAPSNPSPPRPRRINMAQLQQNCNTHEKRLLHGVRQPHNITTTFDKVHTAAATIDTLKTLTGLSLQRPDAFRYGVLAESKLTGLLLYGPPGTGKTLLAKAVAKDTSCAVLEVSPAQVYEKWVGEGEKMVRAVFSLAKKLSPCIVFVDEADALLSSRGLHERNTHRENITQFLTEWEGMGEHNVFVMAATNRPFDLDDAVLRRLPRRVLVDLPSAEDRAGILKIHLQGETLDESISIKELADRTPYFSGSDIKNLCVAAALAAVKAENALARQHKDDEGFKLPEKRVLSKTHFDTALQEISASISADMGSLKAIKKFDDEFGEGRDRGKKKGFGFGGLGEVGKSDDAARVRGT